MDVEKEVGETIRYFVEGAVAGILIVIAIKALCSML